MSSSLTINSRLNQQLWQPSLANSTIHEEEGPQNEVYADLLAEETEENEPDDGSTFTSSPSIPDENIDFDLVYTLHTFEATVEGQASVSKGDYLALLDDTNSYWWLVKVLKSNQVGYIPAEHIETPFERLARLNKHRNSGITDITLDKSLPPSCTIKKRHNVTMAKDILYQSHTILLGDDDEELEDIYEEWEDVMVDQDSQATISGVITQDDLSLIDEIEGLLQDQESPKYQNVSEPLVTTLQALMPDTISACPPLPTVSSPSDKAFKAPLAASFLRLFSRGKRSVGNKGAIKGLTAPSLSNQASRPDRSPLRRNSSSNNAAISSTLDSSATILRVYAGNINVNATYNSVLVDDHTKADALLRQAIDRFHISQIESNAHGSSSQRSLSSGVEYYLTFKPTIGDELVLLPQDKPLVIHQSLKGHLTTPMPAFAKQQAEFPIVDRRTSIEDSARFYLHKRIKRVNEQDGKLYVKVSLYHQDDRSNNKNSRLSTRQPSIRLRKKLISKSPTALSQIDKLIAISSVATVADLIHLALTKFRLSQHISYVMTLKSNHQETNLDPQCKLIQVLSNDTTDEQFVLRRSSRPVEPLLTPIPVTALNTDTEMVLRRLERALEIYPSNTAPSRLHLDPHQPKLAVMRNINHGVDVYLPHGILRSKPISQDQILYTLMAYRESRWERVVQRTLPPVIDGLDADLQALGRFGAHVLMSGTTTVVPDLCCLEELEWELQRIMASHS